jgi:multiple sugar transport system substrate-binding protein
LENPFWKQSTDPYIASADRAIVRGETRLFYTVQNPAYSLVLKENVWGKAIARVLLDNYSSDRAADEAIERIETIFREWE